jgi:hypothetical protein
MYGFFTVLKIAFDFKLSVVFWSKLFRLFMSMEKLIRMSEKSSLSFVTSKSFTTALAPKLQ